MVDRGIIENSLSAMQAAIDEGVGIELDVQLSADHEAMVFHDNRLERLTEREGRLRDIPADALGMIQLSGSNDRIADLATVLARIDGCVPVLIELKDQDGAMGPDTGALEQAVARALADYSGPAAVMSFNPHSIREMARLSPLTPRGLVTSSYHAKDWSLPPQTRARLRKIPDYTRAKACFISHQADDLNRPRVGELKRDGAALLCWTIRSQKQADSALKTADNITFEGFSPRKRQR